MAVGWECGECGFQMKAEPEYHDCDERMIVRHREKIVSAAIADLNGQWQAFLETAQGQFELVYARRRLKRAAA